MIRDAIARHSSAESEPQGPSGSSIGGPGATLRNHSSHAIFAVVPSGEGECIIEPSVRCDHCGYCKSLGH
jgi:hypothetical protein